MSTGFNLKDNFNHETVVQWECQNGQLIETIKYKTLHVHGQATE
jgi:hypothetical protein